MVGIIDYGLSNLKSVAGAVKKLGHPYVVTGKPGELETVDQLILPGVGAFADGMKNLEKLGLVQALNRMVLEQKKPILGICLGAQLMCGESFEFGHTNGLNWFDASVVKFKLEENLRVPHIGWNECYQVKPSHLFREIPDPSLFYFVHSYHFQSNEEGIVVGECEYGARFAAAMVKDNICAVQFHPEKSQLMGLRFLQNFLENNR